jgi:hypothetical protein
VYVRAVCFVIALSFPLHSHTTHTHTSPISLPTPPTSAATVQCRPPRSSFRASARLPVCPRQSIGDRLQLAALCQATGTRLPEPCTRATGGEQALALLRQSWGNRPRTLQNASEHLKALVRHAGFTPAVALVTEQLVASARRTEDLAWGDDPPAVPGVDADAVRDAHTEYCLESRALFRNPREALTGVCEPACAWLVRCTRWVLLLCAVVHACAGACPCVCPVRGFPHCPSGSGAGPRTCLAKRLRAFSCAAVCVLPA